MIISVIIPLYNKASCTNRANYSIFDQNIPVSKIIAVDDGSTDGGGEIVKPFFDPRIFYLGRTIQGFLKLCCKIARKIIVKKFAGKLLPIQKHSVKTLMIP